MYIYDLAAVVLLHKLNNSMLIMRAVSTFTWVSLIKDYWNDNECKNLFCHMINNDENNETNIHVNSGLLVT